MSDSPLLISEQFYSIQGEGPTLGTPAVFLRLAACNLQCSGFTYRDPKTNEHLGCDTKAVWRRSERWDIEPLIDHWEKNAWLSALSNGAHLILTGGEPTLQETKLTAFLQALDARLPERVFVEIETNATRSMTKPFFSRLDQINASPKLMHSGESRQARYHPGVIQQYLSHPNAYFKFVVRDETDFNEITTDFEIALSIPKKQILIMAEGGTRHALQQKIPALITACKARNLRYTPRLHIDIWDEATGV